MCASVSPASVLDFWCALRRSRRTRHCRVQSGRLWRSVIFDAVCFGYHAGSYRFRVKTRWYRDGYFWPCTHAFKQASSRMFKIW